MVHEHEPDPVDEHRMLQRSRRWDLWGALIVVLGAAAIAVVTGLLLGPMIHAALGYP